MVNDGEYLYPDPMRDKVVDGESGTDIAKYTGSTTGTTRNNKSCSCFAARAIDDIRRIGELEHWVLPVDKTEVDRMKRLVREVLAGQP